MAEKVDERCTLVHAFAEFELLPDLLARIPEPQFDRHSVQDRLGYELPKAEIDEVVALERWTDFLAGVRPNLDHAEPEDLPDGVPVARYLAEDAWRLAKRLGWVSNEGVSLLGRPLVNIAERPWVHRTGYDSMTLLDTIARSLGYRYVGGDGLEVVPLLQEGARRLAETDRIWASYVPGLLLVEFGALIHWAFARPAGARRLCDDLVTYRDVAMRRYDGPSPDVDPMDNVITHADATANLYLETEELAARTELTVTEVRTIAMLLTFAGVLKEHSLGPVNYLVSP